MEAPAWLVAALARYLREAGSPAPDETLTREAQRVIRTWNGPAMTPRTLATLFERLDEIDGPSAEPALLRLAAAYRGSAPAPECEIDPTVVARIEELGASVHSVPADSDDLDACVIADAYLALFAGPPQAFAKHLRAMWEESQLGDRSVYLRERRERLRSILDRPRLFLTPFAQSWEASLRENLEGELSRIALERLDDDPQGHSSTTRRSPKTLIIRRSTARKRAALDRELPPEESANPAPVDVPEREFDDTSSLEDIADLFAHKRRQASSPHD